MIAEELAAWSTSLSPDPLSVEIADTALLDSVACAALGRDSDLLGRISWLDEATRWAVAVHVLDLDDVHLPSTAHISAVCVPAALASGGGARDYLAGAGVMARVGTMLGWKHYSSGWHATTTAGAMGAAACAASSWGLDADQTATALALAVPASGGVQAAFGTDAKALQVGFAVEAGVRAARLAAQGVTASPAAIEQWMTLVGAGMLTVPEVESASPVIPGGLAIKIYPCCYALQRPIAAVRQVRDQIGSDDVRKIVVHTAASSVTPLIHSSPRNGLEGKFSLQYGVVAAILDDRVDAQSFSTPAVARPAAQALMDAVDVITIDGGDGLLAGEVAVDIHLDDRTISTTLTTPPGAPDRPPTASEFESKLDYCLEGTGVHRQDISWSTAGDSLREMLRPERPLAPNVRIG